MVCAVGKSARAGSWDGGAEIGAKAFGAARHSGDSGGGFSFGDHAARRLHRRARGAGGFLRPACAGADCASQWFRRPALPVDRGLAGSSRARIFSGRQPLQGAYTGNAVGSIAETGGAADQYAGSVHGAHIRLQGGRDCLGRRLAPYGG